MTYIAVATALPTKVKRAEKNVKVTKWYEYHREYKTIGVRKMKTKFKQRATMKNPNMTLETIRMSFRIVITSAGRVMVAPAKSSLRIIWTGLNQ